MALEQYVTFDSILRNDVASLDNILQDGETCLLEVTADEKIFTEDDLIDLIDMTKRMQVTRRIVIGLTKKELQVLAMRFGLTQILAP